MKKIVLPQRKPTGRTLVASGTAVLALSASFASAVSVPADAAAHHWRNRTCTLRGHAAPDCTWVYWRNAYMHGVKNTGVRIICPNSGKKAVHNIWFIYRDRKDLSVASRHPSAKPCNTTIPVDVPMHRKMITVVITFDVGGHSVEHRPRISHNNYLKTAD